MLVYEIGLAYLHIKASKADKKKFKVLIDEKYFFFDNLENLNRKIGLYCRLIKESKNLRFKSYRTEIVIRLLC
jgi:hypothetical protein